jgi:hypothetical protein
MLQSLAEHNRFYGITSTVASLNPADFRGTHAKRSALKSHLLTQILPPQRRQFLSKISTLRRMVVNLAKGFRNAAEELASHGAAVQTAPLWAYLDTGQFDLNTCLRESMVLLKCFLRALPDDQLPRFQKTVMTYMTQFEIAPASSRI